MSTDQVVAATPTASGAQEAPSAQTTANVSTGVDAAPETKRAEETSAKSGEKETLLDAVLAGAKNAEGKAEAAPKDAADPAQKDDDEDEPDDANDEDLSTVKPIDEAEFEKGQRKFSRRRVKQLFRQLEHTRSELEGLRPRAERAAELQDFLVGNRITSDEFGDMLSALAAIKRGDAQRFMQLVGPAYQRALELAGQTVPPDIQEQVRQGYLTTQAARQLAQERARAAHLEEMNRATEAQYAQQLEIQGRLQIKSAVEAWENQVRATDPEYGRKEQLVLAYSKALMRDAELDGRPVRDPQTAVHLVRKAYEQANREFQSLAPPPKATPKTPSSTQASTGGTTVAEPRSLLDAMRQGLEKAAARL